MNVERYRQKYLRALHIKATSVVFFFEDDLELKIETSSVPAKFGDMREGALKFPQPIYVSMKSSAVGTYLQTISQSREEDRDMVTLSFYDNRTTGVLDVFVFCQCEGLPGAADYCPVILYLIEGDK